MNDSLPLAYIVSAIDKTKFTPGRLRIRIPQRRRDPDFFNGIQTQIEKMPGVLHVRSNSKTGSILIQHDEENGGLLNRINHLRLFQLKRKEEIPREHLRLAMPKLTKKEIATVKLFLFSGFALTQVIRGHALGAGTSLFDQAQNYFYEALTAEDA